MDNKGTGAITLIVAVIFFIITLMFLVGCNYQFVDLEYDFDYAIINLGGEYKTIEVQKWKDYDGEQLQVTAKNGTVYLTSSFNCTLIKKGE